MKNTIKLISVIVVLALVASSITACLSSEDENWQERWDKTVVKGKARNVIIRYVWSFSSQIPYEVKLERGKVASFVELFKDISFSEFTDADEIMKLSISLSPTYTVDFICNFEVNKQDDAFVYDDTGSRFKYAVQARVVENDGHVYVKEKNGDTEKWYKSHETVNVDKLLEYYNDAPRYEG